MDVLTIEQIEQCRVMLKALTVDASKGHPDEFIMKQPEWSNRVDALCNMAIKADNNKKRHHVEFQEITGASMGVEGCEEYIYRDFPNTCLDDWTWMISVFEEFGLKILSYAERKWPNGEVTVRGQLLIHPDGFAAIARRVVLKQETGFKEK